MDLLLNGQFTKEEREELSKELDLPVFEYVTKSIDPHEVVRFLFRDLDAWTLIRDGLLYSGISAMVKKAVSWLNGKKKNVRTQIAIELVVKNDDKSFSLNLFIPPNNVDNFFLKLKVELDDSFIKNIKDGEVVSVGEKENADKLDIVRF